MKKKAKSKPKRKAQKKRKLSAQDKAIRRLLRKPQVLDGDNYGDVVIG
jgi:hypothetical protein